jgi:hypothetical protein
MLAGSLASETATSRSNERAPGNALEAGQLCLTEMEDWAPDRRKRRDGTGPRLSLRVEIAIQSELWKQHAHIGTLVRKALRTASATVSLEGGEVSDGESGIDPPTCCPFRRIAGMRERCLHCWATL